jgi:hypothetical protein
MMSLWFQASLSETRTAASASQDPAKLLDTHRVSVGLAATAHIL